MRGSTRAAFTLARYLPSLHAVPVRLDDGQVIFVDLRDGRAHTLLAGEPWSVVPWEQDERAIMRRVVRNGDVALDIGAHIGLHLVLLARLVGAQGRVHAFEANQALLPALNVTARHAGNVVVHPHGLGDRREARRFFVPVDRSMASLADWTGGRVGAVETTRCQLVPLDELVAAGGVPIPQFVKCDVEGAEHLVFKGASRTLDRADAPIILYEANAHSARAFGNAIDSATEVLRNQAAADYRIFHVQPNGTLVPLAFREDCDHYNLLAVPARRTGALANLVA
jgi:FkbM family methyltransferase